MSFEGFFTTPWKNERMEPETKDHDPPRRGGWIGRSGPVLAGRRKQKGWPWKKPKDWRKDDENIYIYSVYCICLNLGDERYLMIWNLVMWVEFTYFEVGQTQRFGLPNFESDIAGLSLVWCRSMATKKMWFCPKTPCHVVLILRFYRCQINVYIYTIQYW